jgi:hypothetical protein
MSIVILLISDGSDIRDPEGRHRARGREGATITYCNGPTLHHTKTTLHTMEHKTLISSWNIQGLRSSASGLKSRNPDFIKEIGNTDNVILQETWYRGDGPTGCPQCYRELVVPSTKLPGVKQGRDSAGGILISYRADLTHTIKIVKTGMFYIWLEMNKETISTEKNFLLCATYVPSIESPYFNNDSFSILEGLSNHFPAQGHTLVCGDLNARTGQEPDTLSTQGDKHLPGGDSIPSQICPPRHNNDKTINKNGSQHNSCSSVACWVCT